MNRTLRIATKILFLVAIAVIIASCTHTSKYRIGVSQCSEDDWRLKMNDEIMREALLRDDLEVTILSADDNSEKQKSDLRQLAAEGYDIIIASPNEVDAVTPVLDSIYDAGIPLIIFDRRTNTDNYTSFQGADNRTIGRAAAQYLLSLSENPRVLEIEGNLETSPAIDRHLGFAEFVDENPAMRTLAVADGKWLDARAAFLADSMLKAHPEANAIYAHNDRMAIAAAKVVDSLGRNDIKIVGIDASPEIGIRAVADSIIDATFIYPTEGRQLVKTAMAILEGKPYEKNLIIPTRTAVDLKNADILLVQNEALKDETNNIHELKSHLNTYIKQHNAQTMFLYAVVVIVLLLAVIIFMMMRSFWMQKRSREEIEAQNELLRRQRDEVQQATQSKLSFFTNVSHDLRTPLTLIEEPVNQLRGATNLNTVQQRLVSLAAKNVKILHRLVNQILDLQKYENAKLDLNLSEVNLAAEVRDWTESFREVATRNHLKFKVEVPEDADRYFIAIDPDKVERILFNLIANAFKFTPANGTVAVRLSRDESHIYLTVTDNGKGISAEDLSQVFDRFFKADKVSPQGSGIGLALSRAFAEIHGGSLTAESELGKGSEFTLCLPITHIDASAQQSQTADNKQETPETSDTSDVSAAVTTELGNVDDGDSEPSESGNLILVIDDNPDICTLIGTLLGDTYRVVQAKDGAEGIRRATKFVPDLIICDVMMPGMDGYETCRRIKAEVTTSHIPVMLLTACAMDEQRVAGYECGADAYLTKPFNAEVLVSRINALLENRRRIQQAHQASAGEMKAPADSEQKKQKAPAPTNAIDNEFYRQFAADIEAHLGDSELSVDDIAERMGVSRVQLYRKLKALTNYSPTDLIRNMRLQRASKLLKTTESTVSEICYAVGFSSHSYFTKCYREYFGESPSDVQKRTSKSGL